MSANMESDGIMATTMFSSSISTNGDWSEVLVEACSFNETIDGDIWWKVKFLHPCPIAKTFFGASIIRLEISKLNGLKYTIDT